MGDTDIDGRTVTGQKYGVRIGVNLNNSESNSLPAPMTNIKKFLSLQKVK